MTAALLIGLMGSLHCLGMCGPLVLAIPARKGAAGLRWRNGMLYHSGRILTYSLLGLLLGSLGQGAALFGWQQGISLVLGSVILVLVFVPALGRSVGLSAWMSRQVMRGQQWLRQRTALSAPGWFFGSGLLNGLLPCGLVYVAVAGAVATGHALKGAAFMAVFGTGTLPLLLALPWLWSRVHTPLRHRVQRLLPLLVAVVGVLLIVRGLGLGIPYLSPEVPLAEKVIPICH